MTAPEHKTKALVVATRCTSVEQFVATFHKFCDDSTFFVSTLSERPIGLETAFSIQLDDKTPVLRGLCEVVEAWSTPLNRYGRPGVRLAVKRLTNESLAVFKMLQTARLAAEAEPAPELPAEARASTIDRVSPSSGAPRRPTPPPPMPRTTTGSTPPAPAGAAIARLPLGRIPVATPQAMPRMDPRVSEAPSLPKFDDRSGPVAAPHLPAKPIVAPIPAPQPPRSPPQATPSIIVAADLGPPEPPPGPAPPPLVPKQQSVLEVPEQIAASDDLTNPVAVESRTPGSSFVLPANPLQNLTDQSLGGFVDCALYEETGNFFRAPGYEDSLVDIDDVVVAPPPALAPVQAIRQIGPTAPPMLSPNAFTPSQDPQREFAPEATPLPMLAPQRNSPPRPYSEPLIPPDAVPYTPAPSAPRSAPIDSTAALLAMSGNHRRRWLMIGGAAAIASSLLLVVVLTRDGGGADPKAAPVKVASMDPRTPESVSSHAPAKPAATESDGTAPAAVPAVVPAAVPAVVPPVGPAAIGDLPPIVEPDETVDPSGPPVVGAGPCRLTVSSTPAGSIVRIDDQTIGPSPITFAGPCKRSKIDVKHPRYALGTKFVNLTADKPSEVQVPLQRPTHAITIVTVPPGATISIAGNRAGTTPTSVKVMGFTGMKLTVEKRGFKPMVQKVYSKVDGERITLRLSKW